MADYQEESDSSDEIEDDGYQDEMSVAQQNNDFLPPIERLYQFSISDNIYNRQRVGRSVVETLRVVHENPADVSRVMSIIENTASDTEPAVRGEMMEHLPHIVMICHEIGMPTWPSIVEHLLPIVLKTITDLDNQVRKTAQTALLVLMEQNLISQHFVEDQLCPFIVKLTHFEECLEHHPSIIALMSKMAPLLGCEITEQLFVPQFSVLCSHEFVPIRKACASNFGDFCAVVSRHVTETQLLGRFCELARDIDWNVRKACAEVIMSVSCACCLETRKAVLAPVFDRLLDDVTQWVRKSAFQTLGPFITTFAEPSITGLAYNQQGELVLTNPEGYEFRLAYEEVNNINSLFETWTQRIEKQNLNGDEQKIKESTSDSLEDSEFNNFLYWREPILDIDSDLTVDSTSTNKPDEETCTEDTSISNEIDDKSTALTTKLESMSLCTHLSNKQANLEECLQESVSPDQQTIVPQSLIDHFVSMCDPSTASMTDVDLPHHCAFSLPAVALTLGARHWDLLRDTYTTLASDQQWKVRRTVASSIHELAAIVGQDVATQDLVPIFSGLIKDLDEVRIGALKHLAYFLRLLQPAGRNQFLPRLADFLKTEYDYNWRFREELACQLQDALSLFSPSDTCTHLSPVAISLLLDHVAAVRQAALLLVKELVGHVSSNCALLRTLLAELAEQFAHSARWNRRQTFALLCSKLVGGRVLSDEMFARDVLPHLLDLTWDPVPNTRLAVARTISQDIMDNQYFCNEQNPHHEVLTQALKRLQSDKDRDVKYFAALKPNRGSYSNFALT